MNGPPETTPAADVKFGAFKGVFLPSILTLLGVVMYLRMGWMVGHAGLVGVLAIVALGSFIVLLTGLSISATATNMRVGAGGAYYMISRSFGFEAGAAIGFPLYVAQTLGVSFYLVGFSESLQLFFPGMDPILPALSGLVVLGILTYLSADLVLKAQGVIFAMIALSLLSFAMGKPMVVSGEILPPTGSPGFWTIFAVFFPAVTGIEAGLSMSGELKNPARALPWGTLGAVLVSWAIYSALVVLMAERAPAGILAADSLVMAKTSRFLPLFLVGLWGASLSSALGSLLGAPRTLQALAKDGVLPRFLAQTDVKTGTPQLATIVTILIAGMGVLLGDLNAIGPLLTMFFLTSYGLLNLSAGLEGLIGNPSWRPQFKNPPILSLAGAAACLGAMLLIDAGATMVALALVALVYVLLTRRNITPRWSDFRRAIVTYLARQSIYQLHRYGRNPRSWRPHLLLLSGSPGTRWHLVEISDAITHGQGFLTVAAVVTEERVDSGHLENLERSLRNLLEKKGVPALTEIHLARNPYEGMRNLVRAYGIGPVSPNTVVMGCNQKGDNALEYARVLLEAHRQGKNLMLIRKSERDLRPGAKHRNVDVWWDCRSASDSFMLTMAYMIQTSEEWRKSRLRLRTLVSRAEEIEGEKKRLTEFLRNGRIEAEIDIVAHSVENSVFQNIRERSGDTDLLVLGLRPPEDEESDQGYADYYAGVMRDTEGFPCTLLCLPGEALDFRQIFT